MSDPNIPNQAGAACETVDRAKELLHDLNQLVQRCGTVEIRANTDRSVDVRCAGIACYAHSAESALRARIALDVMRVTHGIGATEAGTTKMTGGMVGAAINTAINKQRQP